MAGLRFTKMSDRFFAIYGIRIARLLGKRWDQIADTRHILQRLYHVPVDWFCYPSGHYDPAVVAAVETAGNATLSRIS